MTSRNLIPALLAGAAMILGAMAPAAQAWPGSNGEIVFGAYDRGGEARARGLGIRIAPLGASREEITPLTEDPGDGEPQVSPDGRRVVFARASSTEPTNEFSPSTIYVIDTDGSGLRAITDGRHVDREPAFSASGERIYFTRESPAGGLDIFSVDLGGGEVRRITSGLTDDYHPRAAPGGRIITFERRLIGPHSVRYQHVFTARADGSGPRDLTPDLPDRLPASDPEFSPDGRRIVYSTGDRLLSVRPDGTRPRRLTPARPGSQQVFADPTYSPDARSLLFTISTPGGRSSLHRLDLRRLRGLPNPLGEPHLGVRSPSWLPVS